jgi:hypothetical protein
MAIPKSFSDFLQHPCPGLVFPVHERAMQPERAYPTPHLLGGPATPAELRELDALIFPSRSSHQTLLAFYAMHDGAFLLRLCRPDDDEDAGAVSLLPISQWREFTQPYLEGGDMAWAMENCPLYTHGNWRVIGVSPSEGLSFVMFFDGEYEGRALAGRMFCIGLDGYLGYEEELASSFDDFLDQIGRDPVAFFDKIGFCWHIDMGNGSGFGDPIGGYVPDVRKHPAFREWPK